MIQIATIQAKCEKCDAAHGRVRTLDCGHHYCIVCLEGQHDDWTKGCKQPCQMCLKVTVPAKNDLRNLTFDTSIANMANFGLQASGGQAAITAGGGTDKLRPGKIGHADSHMPDHHMREKAVLAAVEAVQTYDDYWDRAKHVTDKFHALGDGTWSCYIRKHGTSDDSAVSTSTFEQKKIVIRIGSCYFKLWKSALHCNHQL